MKSKGNKKTNHVLFHKVPLGSTFVYLGEQYIKFAPKKGMSKTGQLVSISDATLVEVD